jgi:hypothetical protein
MATRIYGACMLAAAWLAPASAGDVYLDQPHDFVGFAPSEESTAVPWARTADDFFVADSHAFELRAISVELIVSYPNMPMEFALDIHQGSLPEDPALTFGFPSEIIDLGPWNGASDLRLLRIVFDIDDFVLGGPQRYWVSPYAIGNGSGTDRAWWGTAGNGVVHDNEGYFKSEHFGVPDWTPISQSGILDFSTDFAMTIEAKIIPAPGALALMAVAGCKRGSRRRRA